MDDLISRQAAIDVLEEQLHANGYSNVALVSELNRSIGYIMRLPSAQPSAERRGRKRGKWILDTIYPSGVKKYHCPYCKEEYTVHEKYEGVFRKKYCSNCGADLRGETDEDDN